MHANLTTKQNLELMLDGLLA